MAILEAIWGTGFLSPGGPAHLAKIVEGLDLHDKDVLDVGCGIGGFDLLLAGEYGARVIGLDVEQPLIDHATASVAKAGLSDRVDIRLYEPGPLPFPDGSFDVVFGKDAWLHIPDKSAFFADVYRVLRPGGLIAAGDWCRQPGPITSKMNSFFELEKVSYSMEPHAAYEAYLAGAGFTDIRIVEFIDDYLVIAREEAERFRGGLGGDIVARVGSEFYDDTVAVWDAMVDVLGERSLQPSRIRAHKS